MQDSAIVATEVEQETMPSYQIVALNSQFQGHPIVRWQISRNNVCYSQSYYITLIGSHTRATE